MQGSAKSAGTAITIDQMPAHTHPLSYRVGGGGGNTWYTDPGTREGWNIDANNAIGNTGGGQAHSHNIPYTGVVVWKRTA